MKNLADGVIDYLWFLNFCEEEDCDLDHTLKLLEGLSWNIENLYSTEEKQALSDAASRRLKSDAVHPEHKQFFGAIANNRFDGYL